MLFPLFSGKHYSPLLRYHLGDKWARINYALRLMEAGPVSLEKYFPFPKHGRLVSRLTSGRARHLKSRYPFVLVINTKDLTSCQIVNSLDLGDFRPPIVFSDRVTYSHYGTLVDNPNASYSCPYYPTKIRHTPNQSKTIALSLDASWNAISKTPPLNEPIQKLLKSLPDYKFIQINRKTYPDVVSVIELLSRVAILISVDNGIAHIARSVGVPLFLIEHQLSLDRGFPTFACRYQKVIIDTLPSVVYHYLRRERK